MKIVVVVLVLFVGSAVVAGAIEGITDSEETQENNESDNEAENVVAESENKEKQANKEKADQEAKAKEEKEKKEAKEKEAEEKKKQEEKELKAKEKEEQEKKEAEKEKKKEIVLDDFSTAEYSVENMEAEIKDDKLIFSFRWINQSGEDSPFTALGYVDVSQDGEILEEISGSFDPGNKSGILFKNAYGGAHRVDLEYALDNEEDIRILFGTTLEGNDRKEELIIEID